MKIKKRSVFLALMLASLLVLGACGTKGKSKNSDFTSSESQTSESSTSDESSRDTSSEEIKNKYTVRFLVEGEVVQTSEVEEGELAVYTGEQPTKEASGDVEMYRFRGWDVDIEEPITKDTDFVAQFGDYASVQMIDDFESYDGTSSMNDEGWTSLGYDNTTKRWTSDTAAAASLGMRSEEGEKSLRFDAWENDVGYKFAKFYDAAPFNRAANALQFKLLIPSVNLVKIIIYMETITIEGLDYAPSFTYTLNIESSEFVEYTIPLDDDGWALWSEVGKSIAFVSDWIGMHQDDVVKKFNRIEFYAQGGDGGHGYPYVAFMDSAKFVTLDNPKFSAVDSMTKYYKYTGETASKNTIKLDIEENGDATATVVDLEEPLQIAGKVLIEDKAIIFSSNEKGRLTYIGKLINGGQQIECVSVSGELAETVGQMDMNAVQVLDNFDQYETDGKAYYAGNPNMNNRSGCRGAYYSEYYKGSSSTEWGGSGWSLMEGDGDQLKLMKGEGAHSGNQYLSLKNSTNNGMRYMQWGLFDGSSQKNSFRGSKLSFWAKTDGLVKAFKVSCYSQTTPRNATKDNYVRSQLFERTEAINEWEHFEIELNPNVVYYGFLVFMEKSYLASQTFLFIDDVEIYNASPYATYSA